MVRTSDGRPDTVVGSRLPTVILPQKTTGERRPTNEAVGKTRRSREEGRGGVVSREFFHSVSSGHRFESVGNGGSCLTRKHLSLSVRPAGLEASDQLGLKERDKRFI